MSAASWDYIAALALTLAVELPVVALLVRDDGRAKIVALAALINLFSHPFACLAYWNDVAPFVVIEIAVVVVEAVGYALLARQTWKRALLIALCANVPTAALSIIF